MRVVGGADSVTPRFSPAAQISNVGAGEGRHNDIVEASVDPSDEELHGKEVSLLFLDPRK